MKPTSPGLFLICVSCWSSVLAGEPKSIPVDKLGTTYQLVGKLHAPLGTVVHVEGVIVEGPPVGEDAGLNLRVQRIQRKVTQQGIEIKLVPCSGVRSLPKLETGKTYHMEGFETGGYTGVPLEAFKAGESVQIEVGLCFHTQLVFYKAKVIVPLSTTGEKGG